MNIAITRLDQEQSGERWLPVVGHEGSYDISDRGRVRSLDRTIVFLLTNSGKTVEVVRRLRGRILRPGSNRRGCQSVVLGRGLNKLVHVLVLTTFFGPCPDGLECCHGDGEPSNNWLYNLRWDTHSANMNDATLHGRNGKNAGPGEKCPRAILRDADIPIIRRRLAKIAAIAADFGVSADAIRHIQHDRHWTHIPKEAA